MRKLVALTALILAFLLPLAGCMTPAKTSLEEFSPPFAVPSANQSSADVSAEVSLSHNESPLETSSLYGESPSVNPVEPPPSSPVVPIRTKTEEMRLLLWDIQCNVQSAKKFGQIMSTEDGHYTVENSLRTHFLLYYDRNGAPLYEDIDVSPSDICISFFLPEAEFPFDRDGEYTYVLAWEYGHTDLFPSYRLFTMNPVRVGQYYEFPGILEYTGGLCPDELFYNVYFFIIDEKNSDLPQVSLYDENERLVAEGGWVCVSEGTVYYDLEVEAHIESLKQKIAEGQSKQ